ncbi:sacsin-like isoform X2 [Acropora muricata]|uniref:sacsin-like isoform X2 n=1 Tax=Acropora muricata TaxID=159855 RepID=UPI0034E5C30D
MASSRLEGRSYGQRSPPLTHILRSILERYPDGGQILKEIIQNADDAGATKVYFLLDSRSGFYGRDSLYDVSLAKFQGPALYAQNDALFKESDWENLQRPMQSNKKNDPLKVGRFGIGFNSVYHMTDLPSIVSGDTIAFLDPHEVHFGRNETGKMFSLNDRPLQEHRDQFLPYEDVLDCKISTQFYNGTLFRFPLRNKPSDLSKKNYTPDKVRQLFDALQKEASVILLFLKNLEEIALFETDQSSIRKRIFTVRLNGSCRQEIHNEKKSFLTQVKRLSDGNITNINISLTLSVDEVDNRGAVVNRRWLVHHEIDARDSRLRELSSDLGLLPWIGMATPLDGSQLQALSPSGGRIFCFLPLPPDADAKTGLPVHVHGYFGLTDNRRGLKWPGLDCQNDYTAEWNVRLLEKVGGQAYASLFLYLIEKLAREPGGPSEKANKAYLSWPTVQKVQSHWEGLLKPMFLTLSAENVFWTPANGGKWLRPQDVYLNRMTNSSEIKAAVLESLTQANEAVVTLPAHVMNAIDSMSWVTRSITPAYLRNLLKQKRKGSWNVETLTREKKLYLLEYVLEDQNLHELEGVPLLPLANGNFVEFRPLQYNRDPSTAVYISSTRYSRSLLPNMENKFLADNVYSTALHYLSSVASDGRNLQARFPVQLVKVNRDIAIKLIREILPPEWSGSNHFVYWSPGENGHPPESWLTSVWSWIRNDFSGDLSQLVGLPLIPYTSCGRRALVRLTTSSLAIKDRFQGVSLSVNVVSTLKKLGCIVLENIPSYVDHPYLHNYIAPPNPVGVLKVLQIVGPSNCATRISFSCSKDEKQALRGFLSSTCFNYNQQCLIYCLPFFDAIDRRSFLAAKNGFQFRTVAPFGFQLPGGLPIPDASNIIFLGDTQSKDLLQRLGLTEMHPTAFLSSVVFSGVNNGFYSHHQISTLMCWVLRQYNYMQNSTFRETVRQLHFVVTQSNRLVAPCEVLDPKNSVLQQLFEGNNDKFPHNDFVKEHILQTLRELGMKTFPNTQDILQIAETLENVVDAVAVRKASALLEFLNRNSSLLKTDTALLQGLLSKRWVRRKEDRPISYPRVMPWFQGKGRFYSPREVVSQSKANLVGATMPLVSKSCNQTLETAFGWNNSPPVAHVLAQLRYACSLAPEATRSTEKHYFENMLKEIYQQLLVNMEAATRLITGDSSFPAWIWHGNGFTSPNKAAFSRSFSFNLKPYRYLIPNDFHNFRPFFTRSGVRATVDDADLLDVLELIKEKHETEGVTNDATADQKLAHDILHWIVREDKPLNPKLQQRLLVPIMTWDKTLKLVLCSKCTFCDANWLKKGGNNLPVTNEFPMIHDTISSKIATLLGVPPISTRITCAEALGIEQTGPHEPVTIRLKNILNEYKEGVGVFKELVQNADDAGATEVQFALDWRNHPTEKLLAPGMADCQGPALLLYNNAVFSDEDLINISRLAGATKKEDLEKIGRFGLGFSSVYHFTDVPSFITRNYAVFFDPHTKYLQHQIRDSSKPGIKLDFAINPNNLSFSDQFAPFNGMFGCDTSLPQESKKFFFQGTLFRFPFRTKIGEISDKIYSREEIRNITRSFQESSSSLLLFTQNVQKVSFMEISQTSLGQETSQLLFEVSKETVSIDQPVENSKQKSTFLESCAKWTKKKIEERDGKAPPKQSEVVTISGTLNDKNGTQRHEKCSWLLSSCLGTGESFQLATSEEGKKQGLLSASGIAAKIPPATDSEGVSQPEAVPGEVFCFLPLSIPSGLPVHVNGYFAVTSNRRGIWESSTAETGRFQPLEVRWNRSLMIDALCQAYMQLLKEMTLLQENGKIALYGSFSLWPNPETIKSVAWTPLINSVYQEIARSNLSLVNVEGRLLAFTECLFQDAKLQKIPGSETIISMLGYNVVDLPRFAKKGFEQAGCSDIVEQQTMTPGIFLAEVFFPNIKEIPSDLRDRIVFYLMDHCLVLHSRLRDDSLGSLFFYLLSRNCCIPCGPNQEDLACPKQLINPKGAAAPLFTPEDRRFPFGTGYRKEERLLMLDKLGMMADILDWESLLERAKTVPEIHRLEGQVTAHERVSCIVEYLNTHLDSLDAPSEEITTELRTITMFPVLKKPQYYTMKWKGSNDHGGGFSMLSAKELYDEEHKFVAGSSWSILDESCSSGCGRLNEKTRSLFGFDVREPTVNEVCFQLYQAIDAAIHSDDEAQCLQSVCHSIYKYLQERLSDYTTEIVLEELAQRPWIFIQQKFVSSSQVAFDWNGIGDPYLYQVPNELATNFRPLFQATGVRDHFCAKDFIRTMYEFEKAKRGRPLTQYEFKVITRLIVDLLDVPEAVLQQEDGMIPLPDHDLVMQAARELAINDAPWVTLGIDIRYVHENVSIDLAYKMGAIDIRSKKLARISRPIGQEFGQREKLTDRLKGILKSYPCDNGILKELVQNADDAGATEIHFIYDPRTHAGDRLFSENWKELQGPALCVYNNRPFSEEDLEGIQRLGIGSKTEDPTKTGQYGIGFNAVYHLTDCPSFISNGDTLCILDPHCRYAPGATKTSPGRLIKPIGEEERFDFRDTFPGYLEDHFDLTMSTMFRFPLRNKSMPMTSLISEEHVSHEMMTEFMDLLAIEAKEILLFLNHLKKITLSKIEDNHLKQICSVSVELSGKDALLRGQLSDYIKSSKKMTTNEIQWFGITYPVLIQDTHTEENWLVHQGIGLTPCDATDEVPNGQPFGLLPRVGVAARISHTRARTTQIYKAFCFLPLPLKTGLPVHVNGHFCLDSARRNLWCDEKDEGFRSQWNNFMKKKILPEAYISLLLEARGFVPGSEIETLFFETYQIHEGLRWYQGLFPHFASVDSQWTILASSLFGKICHHDTQLLPLVKRTTTDNVPEPNRGQSYSKEPIRCFWLSPSQGFFNTMPMSRESDQKRRNILLQIGFNLLYSSQTLFKDFKKAATNVREINPEAVINFLQQGAKNIGTLPCPVKETAIGSVLNVLEILYYCMKSQNFAAVMSGLPLLLTEDKVLRCFQESQPVFLSRFSDLVPHKSSLFIHHSIARALFSIEDELFATNQRVLKKFDIPALASLLAETKHDSWYETDNLILWDKNKWPSQKWLQLLWKFIFNISREAPNKFSLNPLYQWPVVPTLSGMLSPVSKSKVILDLISEETWLAGQRKVVRLLRKLGCHEVDAKLIDGDGVGDLSPILKPYLSQPNSRKDVLRVLDYQIKQKNIACILSEDEMVVVLQFLQEDVCSVKVNPRLASIIKRLPFFKTFHGTFVSLQNVSSIYVVPMGLPVEESDVWMTGNQCVFLAPQPKLDCLYRELLRVKDITTTDCYIKFIFPRFPHLEQATRFLHLEYVRDVLLTLNADNNNGSRVISSMWTLAFIPDASGRLCTASHFYDPGVTVFAMMLPRESKPPKPFDDSSWLDLLRKIGLKQKVSKDDFKMFANEVAIQAAQVNRSSRSTLEKKSKVLVKHLLKKTSLHDENFLNDLSAVKFVASQKASDELNLFHKQYLVENGGQDPLLPFIPFKDSVTWTDENERLVWTSASLLPSWAIPDLKCYPKLAKLKVLSKPSLDQVTENVKRISTNVSKSADRERPEPTRRLLGKVMIDVYTFLKEMSACSSNEVSDSCSKACVKIESLLSSIACALVEDGHTFVRCGQLAYNLEEELPPYLYRVPREYGAFEHLFKRLGAMETATPEQFAKLLSSLKESCGEEKMLANELTAAKHAVYGLFYSLHALNNRHKDPETNRKENPLTQFISLYLPSRQGHLLDSRELVLHDCPQYFGLLGDNMYKFLDSLSKYNLTFATPKQLVNLLPSHLQPKSLKSLVKEELHADCKDKQCPADLVGICEETDNLRGVVFSPHLVDGILRILKHQFEKAKLTDEVRNNVCAFQRELEMSCMKELSTELIENASDLSIPNSKRPKEVFCSSGGKSGHKHIFIKHGGDLKHIRRILCREINQLTGCYISEDNWLLLLAILECIDPKQIPSVLDNEDVTEDVESTEIERDPEPGTECPEELHLLLVQFDDFYFRLGEYVAYESEETTDEEPKYVYAKILNRIQRPLSEEQRKYRKRKKEKAENKLLIRYMIDIGSEKKEVDVLDLYKIKRLPKEEENESDPVTESRELEPYKVKTTESREANAIASTSSSRGAAGEPPLPKTLEAALEEVHKALKDISKLPEDKKKKALRRLYLCWHPDKNIHMQEIANEVMKFIQNEMEKSFRGRSAAGGSNNGQQDFSDFFRHWDQRARRQRSSYDNFCRHNPGFTGFTSLSSRRRYQPPNPRLAEIWMSQSREDLRSVQILLTAREPPYCLVCFHCHQVAEKALKASLYALSGIADSQFRTHDLLRLARDLSMLHSGPNVTLLVARLSNYYDETRYPDKHVPPKAPKDVFQDSQQAQEAFTTATNLLTMLEEFLGR